MSVIEAYRFVRRALQKAEFSLCGCVLSALLVHVTAEECFGQSFVWPVDKPTTQAYAARGQLSTWTANGRYEHGMNIHTGADIGGVRKTIVKAAAGGAVVRVYGLSGDGQGNTTSEAIYLWNDSNGEGQFQAGEEEGPLSTGRTTTNHGLGIAIVIQHANGQFSFYGHLDAVRKDIYETVFVEGQSFPVSQGDAIGLMGFSEFSTRHASGIHLHFEIKDSAGLGSEGDQGPYWGYTPGHPDLYGYSDPRLIISGISVDETVPFIV